MPGCAATPESGRRRRDAGTPRPRPAPATSPPPGSRRAPGPAARSAPAAGSRRGGAAARTPAAAGPAGVRRHPRKRATCRLWPLWLPPFGTSPAGWQGWLGNCSQRLTAMRKARSRSKRAIQAVVDTARQRTSEPGARSASDPCGSRNGIVSGIRVRRAMGRD